MTLYALLLAPLAAWGFVHNVIPYEAARRFALAAPDEAMRAVRALVMGAVTFGATYGALAFTLVWASIGIPWIALYVATLPGAGLFYLRYRRQLARHGHRIAVRALFTTNRALLARIEQEQRELLAWFDHLRERFVAAEGSTWTSRSRS
jgi:hypothetical protein